MKLKHCLIALLLMVAVNFTPAILFAQDGSDSTSDGGVIDNGGLPDPDATDVPLDGGISLLVAAGVAYGIKKKYDHNKQGTEE